MWAFILSLGLSATAMKSERVYCLSEDRVSTRLLFFFEASNRSGQALVSLYQGPRMTQQKVRWERAQDETLVGWKGGDQKLFELNFESFGAEGEGVLYVKDTEIAVSCTKI